jgi:thioredoxin-related protein
MRAGSLSAALAFVTVFSACAEGVGRDPYQYFFNDTFGDFSEELQTAKHQGKAGIFMFFEMDDCPFCHRMKTTVLNQPEVQAYYREHFLNFAVDIEGDIEIVDFQGRRTTQKAYAFEVQRVRATPVLAYFDLSGERVLRYIGAPNSPDEFLWLGEFVVDKVYTQLDDNGRPMTFAKYKQMKRSAQR